MATIKDLLDKSPMAKRLYENYDLEVREGGIPEIYDEKELSFHPNGDCGCLEINDDYFYGIRCDHLIWIDGTCEGVEDFWNKKDLMGLPNGEELNMILTIGNHKGETTCQYLIFHRK